MASALTRPIVILAPGGPGLAADTLAGLPLPRDCDCLSAVSACKPGDDPIALQSARLVELATAAGARRNVVLIGHSAGAWATIRAASRMSGNVAAVVLIAAQLFDRIDQPELLAKRLRSLCQPTRELAQRAQSLSTATLPAADSVLLDLLLADLSLTLPVTGFLQRAFLDSCRRSWNLQSVRSFLAKPMCNELPRLAGQVRASMLVINGEDDPWAGAASAMEIDAAAKNCTVEIIAGAGHMPWLDDPHTIGRLLAATVEEARLK